MLSYSVVLQVLMLLCMYAELCWQGKAALLLFIQHETAASYQVWKRSCGAGASSFITMIA